MRRNLSLEWKMKSETELYLSLGSNSGDRNYFIKKALDKLSGAFGVSYARLSAMLQTPSYGFDSADFLNCAVLYNIDSELFTPEVVLEVIEGIESELGRKDKGLTDDLGNRIYTDRTIDIDILFYGDRVIDTPLLKVPHLDMENRVFYLIPLREIASAEIRQTFPQYFEKLF